MTRTRAMVISALALLGPAWLSAQAPADFPANDRNGDGVVTRDEWRGSMRSFGQYDNNRDGVLSGNELPFGRQSEADRSRFDRMDRNGDSVISRYEWRLDIPEFRRLDRNSNGHLTWEEFSYEPAQTASDDPVHSRFNEWDRNGDSVISRHEWPSNRAEFRRLDSDRDGRVTFDEFSDDRGAQTRARTSGVRAAAGELDKNASGVVEGYEWPYNSALFHQLDTDRDSNLSASELANLPRVANLSQLDTNRNGRVDGNEWPGGFAQFRELDANGDSRISSDEYFQRGGDWQRRQRFDAWDTNGDGIIQSTEWKTEAAIFHRLDTNQNSQVEWEEFRSDPQPRNSPEPWRR